MSDALKLENQRIDAGLSRLPPSGLAVDVWLIELDRCDQTAGYLQRLTSPEERSQGDRFQRPSHKDRFFTVRGAVRYLLSSYHPVDPIALRFETGPHGKPRLARDPNWPDIRFNVSHSDALALCAVAVGFEVGVDIEQMNPSSFDLSVADHFFSANEIAELHSLP